MAIIQESRRWSQLPQPMLVSVLQDVPVAHRLSSCALVSTSWAQAATEATSNIAFGQGGRPQRAGDSALLQQYLDRHGRHLTSLAYILGANTDQCLQRLPCPNLQELTLDLEQLVFSSEPAGRVLGLLQDVSKVTTLSLTASTAWVGDVALGLPSLLLLQELTVILPRATDSAVDEVAVFPGAVLPQLQQLTYLKLVGGVRLDSLTPVSALTGLDGLYVSCFLGVVDEGVDAAGQAVTGGAHDGSAEQQQQQQPQQSALQLLRSLCISTPGLLIGRGNSSSPCFAGISALHQLTLKRCVLDPAVLHSMGSLQHLKLQGAFQVQGGVAGMYQLLNHISAMQGLESLSVSRFDLREQPVAAFGALTSSSRLKQLEILDCRLPYRAWEHIFAAGRKLPGLTDLQLQGALFRGERFFTVEDFGCLVTCCSAVETLKLQSMSYHMMHQLSYGPLLQLSHLRDLSIGAVSGEGWSVGMLAQLSGLTALRLGRDCFLSAVGALQLTRLTGLEQLHLHAYNQVVALHSKAPAGQAPDVWYQLLLYCSADEDCQALLLDQESEVLQQLQLAGKNVRLLQDALQAGRLRKQAAAVQHHLLEGLSQAVQEFDSIRDWFDELNTD